MVTTFDEGRTVRLEIDFSCREFAMLHPVLEFQDISDPFRRSFFRLTIWARLLMHDEVNAAGIVTETDKARRFGL